MERMGRDPNPDTVRLIEGIIFPLEVVQAQTVHSLLPDVWDGAGGNYLGKDWSALEILLKTLGVEEPKSVIMFLRYIDSLTMQAKNDEMAKNRKKSESKGPVGQGKHIEVNG
jgi:hypothetical protein